VKRLKNALLVVVLLILAGAVFFHTSRPPVPDANTGPAAATQIEYGPQTVAQWRQALAGASTNQVASIRAFLHSGKDASTGQGFRLNSDGSLREAPTLRAMLLDALGKISPQEAAEEARLILQNKTTPDEWAVSLALCARADSSVETMDFLQQKAEELALYAPWRQNPSTGFLEAFDLFVYTDDTDFLPQLAQFASDNDDPALAHAAFLAVDRLAQDDPLNTLGALEDDPSLLSGRAAMEGDLFARANVSDPEQKALLADYLTSPGRSMQELEAFAGVFPNENFMISDNLLTQTPPLPNAEVLSRYQAAQETVSQWLQDSQFTNVWPQLQQVQGRLNRILQPLPR
jgi:hypothetical protein